MKLMFIASWKKISPILFATNSLVDELKSIVTALKIVKPAKTKVSSVSVSQTHLCSFYEYKVSRSCWPTTMFKITKNTMTHSSTRILLTMSWRRLALKSLNCRNMKDLTLERPVLGLPWSSCKFPMICMFEISRDGLSSWRSKLLYGR